MNMEKLEGRREAFEEVIELVNQFIISSDSGMEQLAYELVKYNMEGRIAEIELEENVILNAMAVDERMHQAELERRSRKAVANIKVNA